MVDLLTIVLYVVLTGWEANLFLLALLAAALHSTHNLHVLKRTRREQQGLLVSVVVPGLFVAVVLSVACMMVGRMVRGWLKRYGGPG